ncbi:MAG TPA: class I SAM-dependent methyltransferase [Anaeromyxobacteraceae bacterium]|nr:class I SAM-dependent methyltransferase [Anaeromyxobacteraceae bacterium]
MSSHREPAAPSPWVMRFAGLIRRGGTVLDLACGSGRHALFLAARGHPVTAVDRDPEALARLAGVEGVAATWADLESAPWPLAGRRFDAVVVANYLHRPLLPAIGEALAAGGVLLYETFMRGHQALGKPSNPDFLLEPGELLRAFADLTPVAFEQGRVEEPRPAVVQRLCAVKGVAAATVRLDAGGGGTRGAGAPGPDEALRGAAPGPERDRGSVDRPDAAD